MEERQYGSSAAQLPPPPPPPPPQQPAMSRFNDGKVERDSSMFSSPEALDDGSPGISVTKIDSDVSFFGKKRPPETQLGVTEDEYDMCHKNRGKAIIFNHELYADNLALSARDGTKADRKRLKETLKKLGFVVQILDDPNKKAILEKLTREKENHYHYSSDCLVVVVLTHGEDGGRLYAHDDFYTVSELWAPFMADNCPALATKPKLFIIQACRGESTSRAVGINPMKMTTTDSIKMPDPMAGESFSIPSEADILVAYSTYEGRVAYRDTEDGAWYINALCDELDHSAKIDDLLTMLTRVNKRVALTKENAKDKQMPSLQSTLTRKVYFHNEDRLKQKIPYSSLTAVHTKLDQILGVVEGATALPLTPAIPMSPGSVRSLTGPSDWDSLRDWSGTNTLKGYTPLPSDSAVLRHAKALKMFLEWRGRSAGEDEVQENGKMILTLLSWWEALDEDTRLFAHKNIVRFLRKHAKDWPVMEVVDVFDSTSAKVEAERSSLPRTRKSSRSSSQSNVSQLSRARPPFK